MTCLRTGDYTGRRAVTLSHSVVLTFFRGSLRPLSSHRVFSTAWCSQERHSSLSLQQEMAFASRRSGQSSFRGPRRSLYASSVAPQVSRQELGFPVSYQAPSCSSCPRSWRQGKALPSTSPMGLPEWTSYGFWMPREPSRESIISSHMETQSNREEARKDRPISTSCRELPSGEIVELV